MAVPKYNEFFPSYLRLLSDGEVHTTRELCDFCADAFHLSDEDRALRLSSGALYLNDRVSWAGSYLKKAGLVEAVAKGKVRITEVGKEAIRNGTEHVTVEFLCKYESFLAFYHPGRPPQSEGASSPSEETALPAHTDETPEERIDSAVKELNASLAESLFEEIMKISPYAFEHLVVKLLVKMGYGSLQRSEEFLTRKSGDEGIDGIVAADKFGFDSVYTQAKQWKRDIPVGRPEIQKFLGALAGQGATKGLFITTSTFTRDAIEFAQKQLHSKIVLVDGKELAKLMIEYDLGISTVATYSVKRIDSDFFSEQL